MRANGRGNRCLRPRPLPTVLNDGHFRPHLRDGRHREDRNESGVTRQSREFRLRLPLSASEFLVHLPDPVALGSLLHGVTDTGAWQHQHGRWPARFDHHLIHRDATAFGGYERLHQPSTAARQQGRRNGAWLPPERKKPGGALSDALGTWVDDLKIDQARVFANDERLAVIEQCCRLRSGSIGY